MYKEKIIDSVTKKEIFRDYTQDEIDAIEKEKIIIALKIKENEKMAKTRASALAKLAALGLTEDEIAAL